MLFISLLWFPLLALADVPPAVKEDQNEQKPNDLTKDSMQQQAEMQKYLSELRKPEPYDMVTMNKYIKAYSQNHEKYQSIEERNSDEISQQNDEQNSINVTRKMDEEPAAPEIIRFELADARVPDKEQLKIIEKGKERKLRNAQNETSVKVKKDMSTEESILIQIKHPKLAVPNSLPQQHGKQNEKRLKTMQELPISVQKAISLVMQKENDKLYGTNRAENKVSYVPKIMEKPWWSLAQHSNEKFKPIYVARHQVHAQPVVLKPVPYYSNYMPLANYANYPYVQHKLPKISYFSPAQPYQFAYGQPTAAPPSNKDKFEQESKLFLENDSQPFKIEVPDKNAVFTENESFNNEANIQDALSSLIGQQPSVQLKGLNELIQLQDQLAAKIRPQDSTAPVLFPLGARLPRPRPYANKTISFLNSIQHPDSTAKPYYPENSTPLPPISLTDFNKLYKNANNLIPSSSPSYFIKDHTPITEEEPLDETTTTTQEPLIIHVTPSQQSIYHHHNYNHQHHPQIYNDNDVVVTTARPINEFKGFDDLTKYQQEDLQYASGYAFGYRVRDFHTGNDFGHTQNRDTDGITRGEYHILLPDGRIQNVRYTADEKGFHADVSYDSASGH